MCLPRARILDYPSSYVLLFVLDRERAADRRRKSPRNTEIPYAEALGDAFSASDRSELYDERNSGREIYRDDARRVTCRDTHANIAVRTFRRGA